jgi:NAD(P)-dependent dehydrogenase (short-subunit alcohol dehydrogenase family)
MFEPCAAGRAGTPDVVANVAALLRERAGGITGSDFLLDGGVTAACYYGDLTPG